MDKTNATVISNFIFMGFTLYPKVEITIFVLCLLMYLITLLGNSILISVSVLDSHLTHPCASSSATCHVWTSGILLLP